MKNVLLGVIATCLILITGKMYLGDMQAAKAAMIEADLYPVVYAICYTAERGNKKACFRESIALKQ